MLEQVQDVIEGPLQEEEAGTWISNLMITEKKWDAGNKDNGERSHIRANLDCLQKISQAIGSTVQL